MTQATRPLRKLAAFALALVASVVVAACDVGAVVPTPVPGTLSVVASFYPIQYFAKRVGGDLVSVYNPVPPGAEPHDLELSPRSIAQIQKADVFLYLGQGFQPAIDRALDTIKGAHMVAKDVSDGVPRIPASAEDGISRSARASAPDPHIWLDPVYAQTMVGNIAQAFSQADPAHKTEYMADAAKAQVELSALNDEYKATLSNCKRNEIITSHAAFAYLARRYGLKQVPIAGLSPEAEPNPARLQEIIQFARQHDAKYIFFETLVDPRVAQLVAREIGAQTLVLNPIEALTADQIKAGQNYMSLMREDLTNLKLALGCGT